MLRVSLDDMKQNLDEHMMYCEQNTRIHWNKGIII